MAKSKAWLVPAGIALLSVGLAGASHGGLGDLFKGRGGGGGGGGGGGAPRGGIMEGALKVAQQVVNRAEKTVDRGEQMIQRGQQMEVRGQAQSDRGREQMAHGQFFKGLVNVVSGELKEAAGQARQDLGREVRDAGERRIDRVRDEVASHGLNPNDVLKFNGPKPDGGGLDGGGGHGGHDVRDGHDGRGGDDHEFRDKPPVPGGPPDQAPGGDGKPPKPGEGPVEGIATGRPIDRILLDPNLRPKPGEEDPEKKPEEELALAATPPVRRGDTVVPNFLGIPVKAELNRPARLSDLVSGSLPLVQAGGQVSPPGSPDASQEGAVRMDAAAAKAALLKAPAAIAGPARIGRTELELQLSRAGQSGVDYAAKLYLAQRAVLADPKSVRAHVLMYEAYLDKGDLADAERALRKALELDPNNPKLHEAMAKLQARRNALQAALASANKAVELSKGRDASVLATRAVIHSLMKNYKLELSDIENAARLDPATYRELFERVQRGDHLSGFDDDSPRSAPGAALAAEKGWRKALGLGALLALLGLAGAGAFLALRGRAPIPLAAAGSAAGPGAEELLDGKYQLVRAVGRGGAGEVFEAVDRSLGRAVAVKKMSSESCAADPGARELFLKEARNLAALNHPAIAAIYDAFEAGSEVCLVFEFVKGRTVGEVLAERRRMGLDAVVEVLRPVCQALDYAHAKGLAHRGIKPSNIMIAEDAQVKLMDFGMRAAGSAPYMAPEAEQGGAGKEGDIYALGVCAYEMLTGGVPFPEPGGLARKAEMNFVRPTVRVPELPKEADELAVMALQPSPELRLKTAGEFLARLDAAAKAMSAARQA